MSPPLGRRQVCSRMFHKDTILRRNNQSASGLIIEDLSLVKTEGEEFNVLYIVLHKRIIPAFQRKQRINYRERGARPPGPPPNHRCSASAVRMCARPYFSVFFPPAFVESQMAQVDRLRSLHNKQRINYRERGARPPGPPPDHRCSAVRSSLFWCFLSTCFRRVADGSGG